MRKTILLAALIFASQLASATAGPEPIEDIPDAVITTLEAKIKISAQQQSGIKNLKDFKVSWEDVKNCIEVRSEMDLSKLMGACTVGFTAFQVQGEAVVVVKYHGYSTAVLYTDVD